ncbi:MAG: DUF3828 domain-containing protein [Bradyrhizobium sp.]|uniref:DUF3828 domain-containing protein n=1 Tax=Bradyrhizobium sp. TaxID=376 RepID=UPI0025B8DF28|nr:DUF3828 domain-containing protein [Bradyrhizobium sp.]MBI5265281.1 DUF3828 domain-containing protein [Bradyrhizobium sp.]
MFNHGKLANLSRSSKFFYDWLSAVCSGAAALLFLLILAVSCHAAGAAAPTEILRGIYREAVKGSTSNWLEPERRGQYLSKSLLALWTKSDAKKPPEGEAGPVDFDLTTDTNALELKSFEVKVESASYSAAVLAVKLNYRKPHYRPGPPAVVTYDFVREQGHWRIDNLRTKAWSVRDMLTQWLIDS